MPHAQLTPFETALLRAVEDLNSTFEAGLKSVAASPVELANLQREFEGLARDIVKRLNGLEQQQRRIWQLLQDG